MRLLILPFAFAASLLLQMSPMQVADAAESSLSRESDWKNLAIFTEESNRFAYCASEASFAGGITLAFARNDEGATNIAVGDTSAKLDKTASYAIKLEIDGKKSFEFNGFSPDGVVLVTPIGTDYAVLEALAKGQNLLYRTSGHEWRFSLSGVAKTLQQLKICADNKGTPSPQAGNAAIDSKPYRTLLDKAGLASISLVTSENGQSVWRTEHVFGGMSARKVKPDSNLDEVLLSYLDGLESQCGGEFDSSFEMSENYGELSLVKADISCAKNGKSTRSALVLSLEHGSLQAYFQETDDSKNWAEAEKIRDRIYAALLP